MGGLGPALVMSVASLSVMLGVQLAPAPGAPVLAIFPRSMSDSDKLAAVFGAGSTFIAPGPVNRTLIVGNAHPGTPSRLRDAGALLVLNAPFPSLCARSPSAVPPTGASNV